MSGKEFSVVMSISTACGGEVCLTVTEPTKTRAELLGRLCSDAVERTLRTFFPEAEGWSEPAGSGGAAGEGVASGASMPGALARQGA